MSIFTTSAGASSILPTDVARDLIITPLTEQSLAFNPAVATTITTAAHEWRAPRLDKDVTAAFVAEGEEIPASDLEFDEIKVVPSKAAALTILSRELADDSSPDAQATVGQSMVRDLTRVINAAFVGNQPSPAPAGLGSLADVETLGLDLSNLDSFSEAQAAAESMGSLLSAFLISPADALAIAKLKAGTGSNQDLLIDKRIVNGLPLIVSQHLPAGTIYGVDSTRIYAVLREDVTLATSADAFFTSDKLAVRSTVRVGFGFADRNAVVKLTAAA